MVKITYRTRGKAIEINCLQSEVIEKVKFFYTLALVTEVKSAKIIVEFVDGSSRVLSYAKFD